MKGLEIYLIPCAVSNVIGLLILWAAYKKPKLARGLFSLLFGWACWYNFTTAFESPQMYLEYATMSIPLYSDFIEGWFKDHITIMVSAIAIGQGLIALGILLQGWWVRLACLGIIIFLISIAPLGVGAGFPFSITVSVAAYRVMRKDDKAFLMKWKPMHTSHVDPY
ncbi:hypothetical protein [Fodinibius sediminis]|uniref:Uncharacterized protein n=1 Tax=Fodinibius sediminis TaxID=1214077 RepID=A0A521CM52_9BACT|nr:hypothetical protein [Fodinibius sediminis]SMO60522.1 hypothetical protein SAMN06265218_106202 [Fodinibius sediminis]